MSVVKTLLGIFFFWAGLSIFSFSQQELIKDFTAKFSGVSYETVYEMTGSNSASMKFYNEELSGFAEYNFLYYLNADRDTMMLFFRNDPCVTELCAREMTEYRRKNGQWEETQAPWCNRDFLHKMVFNTQHRRDTGRDVTYYTGWQFSLADDSLIRAGYIDRYEVEFEPDSTQPRKHWIEDYYEAFLELNAGEWKLRD